ARTEDLSRDPVQQLLIFVGLFRESAKELSSPFPGCLFASYCYERKLFDDEIHDIMREAMLTWRNRLGAKLRQAIAAMPPQRPVDPDSLADMMIAVFEGAFVVSRTVRDPSILASQLEHLRNYLELLFAGMT